MNSTLQVWHVKEARRRAWRGESVRKIAADLKVNYGPVYMAIRGQTWSSIVKPAPVPAGVMFEAKKQRANAPRTCMNCGRCYQKRGTTERCAACYSYLKRHGVDKPDSWDSGLHNRIHIADNTLERLYEWYKKGMSIEKICETYPLKPETLRRRFRDAGYKMRSHAGTKQQMNEGLVRQARRLVYVEGLKVSEVAKQMNLKYITVYSAVRGQTWQAVGGLMPDTGEGSKPCTRCEILTAHPSGLCAYCRERPSVH